MRIGSGYDAHRLAAGRPMVLCGITLPCDFGPVGYSDGDAPLHALSDALLGGLALGDIGQHFPDNDPENLDIDSGIILKQVYDLIVKKGYALGNADITIILEKPKLASYINAMREKVAQILNCSVDQISVKATTEEKMGFTGSGEGVAAMATVLLNKKD